jgi:hypothetical protein
VRVFHTESERNQTKNLASTSLCGCLVHETSHKSVENTETPGTSAFTPVREKRMSLRPFPRTSSRRHRMSCKGSSHWVHVTDGERRLPTSRSFLLRNERPTTLSPVCSHTATQSVPFTSLTQASTYKYNRQARTGTASFPARHLLALTYYRIQKYKFVFFLMQMISVSVMKLWVVKHMPTESRHSTSNWGKM